MLLMHKYLILFLKCGVHRFDVRFQIGRTENVKNCLNPEFVHAFEIDYYFEEVQKLFFAVYDIDNKTEKLTDDDFLGQMECTLGQVNG